jgi:D-3-phosphoglycerate dehydrogenase
MPKVLISDKLSPRAVEIFKERGVEVDYLTDLTPTQLIERIPEYDGLAIRSSTKVTAEVLAAATRLRVVGRAGIGVDNVDVPAATARGVVVMNTPFGNSITTAEHAIALMFSLARSIPQANASTHAGKWEKSKFNGVELFGKVLGVIGCGNIGSIVADRGQGLKMKVIAYDPFLSEERAVALGVEKVELDELVVRADIITLHVPLTEQTRNILSEARLRAMKKGSFVINAARGGLVDEAALRKAVDDGHLGGAAIDVFSEEPAKQSVLFGSDKIICTPHLGASTSEAQENVALQVAEQMADYLIDGAVSNALNMPSLTAEEAARLGPYMKLAEQVGGFSGQITESSLEAVEIRYEGEIAALNTKPLTAIILRALLAPMMDTVNMVNAPVLAKERGIIVSETRQEKCSSFRSIVRVEIKSQRRERSVAGTLYDGAHPRLIEVDDVAVEIELSPHMLYVRNADKPGFIGNLGRTLGDAGVNIASFDLGRTAPGGEAVCLVSTDQAVDKALLAKIAAIPNVIQARTLIFG